MLTPAPWRSVATTKTGRCKPTRRLALEKGRLIDEYGVMRAAGPIGLAEWAPKRHPQYQGREHSGSTYGGCQDDCPRNHSPSPRTCGTIEAMTEQCIAAMPRIRRHVDWEAVERDYRATQMTLRELGSKHGCDHAAIARKASKCEWKKDLASAVRKATNAKLIEQAVTKVVNDRQQAVTTVVLAAAELNKQMILGHRRRLTDLADAVEHAKAKLLSLGVGVADVREALIFVQGVCHLASATRTLIEQERRAFNLDEQQPVETSPTVHDGTGISRLRAKFDEASARRPGDWACATSGLAGARPKPVPRYLAKIEHLTYVVCHPCSPALFGSAQAASPRAH